MWVSFSEQVNKIFESARRFPLQLVAGAFVGFCVGTSLARRWAVDHHKETPGLTYLAIVSGPIVLAVGLVVVLHLKDAVRQRQARRKAVNRVLRVFLASGWLSLTAWIVLACAVSLFLAVALA